MLKLFIKVGIVVFKFVWFNIFVNVVINNKVIMVVWLYGLLWILCFVFVVILFLIFIFDFN